MTTGPTTTTTNAPTTGPLSGLRVLDIGEGVAGPFCAKLLGDLGADVVKVERPDAGDTTRQIGPFPNGEAHIEKSAAFFFLNTSKRSVTIDLDAADGIDQLRLLVQRYDVIVSSDTAEALTARGFGPAEVRNWNAAAILTTVSGFGSFGPYSGYQSSHLVNCAVGGWANLCGLPDREPLQTGGAISETLAGAYAAAATLMAVHARARHGRGEHIDVSAQEAVIAGAQLPTLLYEYRGITPERYSSIGSGAGAAFMLPTSNGHIGLNALTLPQWHMLCKFLGREDIAEDPRFEGISWTNPDERIEEIRQAFREALAERTAEELFHQAEEWRVPFGLVPSLGELVELPPHKERNFYTTLDHPACGHVAVPSVPFKSTSVETEPTRPPLLGEHTQDVLSDITSDPAQPGAKRDSEGSEVNPLPLAGIRILDLSMFFAGPVAAQMAADAGADVIKVESVQRIDGWRGSGTLSEEGIPTWESSPYFNWVNRNKRDVTLDLNDPRGQAVVKTLVRDADILIENYTPRVMAKFGLDYATLQAIKPDLVMISLSGFGATTSWRDYVAFGMSTEQMSGVSHLTGYEDDEPLFTGMTGGDLFSGVMGATAILSALWHRDRTGMGQHIDFSQIEACNVYIGDAMAGWSLAGYDPGRQGNRHPSYAPQGCYPCRNGWIGITCATNDQWTTLAGLIGRAEWTATIGDAKARQAQASAIDEAIGDWTQARDKIALMHELQAAGIPAGAVMNGPDMLADPHLAARGAFLEQDRPGLGVKHYPNQPYRFARSEPPPNERAPLLGEHLEEVLTELAGLTSDDIVELVIDDVVGTVPLAAR
jgi:crotonobetainyl-CoA:carnitine CoA-transferase CaiB-like acyl-CoA transferase